MLVPLERVWKIKPKEKEYVFKLYSFKGQKDFSSNDLLKGQSIVFMPERYEAEEKYNHNMLYAVSTNNLVKVISICN